MNNELLMRGAVFLIVVCAIAFGMYYFTTKTEVGAELRQGASDTFFNIFTNEYDNNAEREG